MHKPFNEEWSNIDTKSFISHGQEEQRAPTNGCLTFVFLPGRVRGLGWSYREHQTPSSYSIGSSWRCWCQNIVPPNQNATSLRIPRSLSWHNVPSDKQRETNRELIHSVTGTNCFWGCGSQGERVVSPCGRWYRLDDHQHRNNNQIIGLPVVSLFGQAPFTHN